MKTLITLLMALLLSGCMPAIAQDTNVLAVATNYLDMAICSSRTNRAITSDVVGYTTVSYRGEDYRTVPMDKVDHKKWYSVSYDPGRRNPRWVAWIITTNVAIATRDGMTFKPDPVFKASALAAEYAASGYDMGHLCPAQDMAWCTNAIKSTFVTSNVSPQRPQLNRGDWRELETSLRAEARYGAIHCIAGPVWMSGNTNVIGSGIGVPDAFFKIAYGGTSTTIRAWIFSNRDGNKPLHEYKVKLETVEELTGLIFPTRYN